MSERENDKELKIKEGIERINDDLLDNVTGGINAKKSSKPNLSDTSLKNNLTSLS
ncbi:MAG: hypothetical protein K6E33_01390 [Lachnospiraceae bacterium]|nr:hypothetical protein [Lachnospiraceae bacterium]